MVFRNGWVFSINNKQLTIGLLDGWIVGWLDGWIVGLLDFWIVGWLDWQIVEAFNRLIVGL